MLYNVFMNKIYILIVLILVVGLGYWMLGGGGSSTNQEGSNTGATPVVKITTPTASPTSGPAPLKVDFKIAFGDKVDRGSLYYTIEFGDGAQAGFQRTGEAYVQYTYTKAGNYEAVITERTGCDEKSCQGPTSTFKTFKVEVK